MAATWFTSDLHFGHHNVIGYCDRPFRDVDHMNQGLVEAWNTTVAPDATVWVLGDVAMGNLDRSLRPVARLHGRKILLCGNHDRPFRGSGAPRPDWERRYLDAGFAEIHHGIARVDVGHHLGVAACHFPYVGDSGTEDRYVEHRPLLSAAPLLHGHVHDRWRVNGQMVNVGVDAWAGRPVSAEELEAVLDGGNQHLARLPWALPSRT